MMRKFLWIVPFLFLSAAIGTTTARADTYDDYSISFTGANAPTASAGTVLTYDATTGAFTTPSFSVTYEGSLYTFALNLAPPIATNPPTADVIVFEALPFGAIFIQDLTAGSILYDSVGSKPGF